MRSPDALPPWSPLSVTLLTLFLPAGGIVLTIHNMYRLKVLDRAQAWRMAAGAICVFAVGLGIILGLAPVDKSGIAQPTQGAELIFSLPSALLAFLAHRGPFRGWRNDHRVDPTASWLQAVGWALAYTTCTVVLVVPIALIVQVYQTPGSGGALAL
jgi:hypothetical protein